MARILALAWTPLMLSRVVDHGEELQLLAPRDHQVRRVDVIASLPVPARFLLKLPSNDRTPSRGDLRLSTGGTRLAPWL